MAKVECFYQKKIDCWLVESESELREILELNKFHRIKIETVDGIVKLLCFKGFSQSEQYTHKIFQGFPCFLVRTDFCGKDIEWFNILSKEEFKLSDMYKLAKNKQNKI